MPPYPMPSAPATELPHSNGETPMARASKLQAPEAKATETDPTLTPFDAEQDPVLDLEPEQQVQPEEPIDAAPPSRRREPEMPKELTDSDLDFIASVITGPQIDRLIRLKANLAKRDEYRSKGITPSTHVIVQGGLTHTYLDAKGVPTRKDSKEGEALEIARIPRDHLVSLQAAGHVASPV
jgi:hypothetical protein